MRRGLLYTVKPWFVARLRGVTTFLIARGVTPDSVTLGAIPVGLGISASLVFGHEWGPLWLLVPPLALLLMAVNAIDGDVAREAGAETARGAALNELVDRAGDLLLIGPAFVLAGPRIGLAALLAVLAAESVALIGWGASGERALGGLMGKPDRAGLISLGSVAAAMSDERAFAAAYLVIAVGSFITCVQRVRTVLTPVRPEREHIGVR